MVQVLGIGGFFFRSKDPEGLAEWYKIHLGITPAPTDETNTPVSQGTDGRGQRCRC